MWAFPEPEDVVPTRTQLGLDTVFVKLSDYGISQFAATQGARGLLGTPGFMAPEILKYHGKEVGGANSLHCSHWCLTFNPIMPDHVVDL